MLKNNYPKRYSYCDKVEGKKILLPKFLNRKFENTLYTMFVRKSLNHNMYEVYVSEKTNKYRYVYSCGKAKAITVFKVAKKFNIEIK